MGYTLEKVKALVEKVLESPSDRFVRMVYVDCLIAFAQHKNDQIAKSFIDSRETYLDTGILASLGEWDARKQLYKRSSFDNKDVEFLNIAGEIIEKALSEQK